MNNKTVKINHDGIVNCSLCINVFNASPNKSFVNTINNIATIHNKINKENWIKLPYLLLYNLIANNLNDLHSFLTEHDTKIYAENNADIVENIK